MTRATVIGYSTVRNSALKPGAVRIFCDLHHIGQGIMIPGLTCVLRRSTIIRHNRYSAEITDDNGNQLRSTFDVFFTKYVDHHGNACTEAVSLRKFGARYIDIDTPLLLAHAKRSTLQMRGV
ncbi:hypothetical protein HWV62_22365 [Athelia sp. TMB]|nr:hypothetical protein HWV62_22365 [Athelia sp. TMB]